MWATNAANFHHNIFKIMLSRLEAQGYGVCEYTTTDEINPMNHPLFSPPILELARNSFLYLNRKET